MTYHARTLELLGAEGRRKRRPVPELAAWARASGVVLPAAYVEWAELGGGALLEKYSNCSEFQRDAPVLHTMEGRRGLRFERENQGNFTTVVLLDHGDDPPVLFGWLGRPPWVTYAARFSEAVYAQVFDWQFLVEREEENGVEPENEDDVPGRFARDGLTLRTDRHLSALRERYSELVATRFVVDGEPYATHRFLPFPPSTHARVLALVYPDRTTYVSLMGEGARDMLAGIETDLLEAFGDDVAPRTFGLVKYALDYIGVCLLREELVQLRHACVQAPSPGALAALAESDRRTPFRHRDQDPWLDHSLSLKKETRYVLSWGGVSIAVVRVGRGSWSIESIRTGAEAGP